MPEDNDVDWDEVEAREMAEDDMLDLRAQNEKMRKIILAADEMRYPILIGGVGDGSFDGMTIEGEPFYSAAWKKCIEKFDELRKEIEL